MLLSSHHISDEIFISLQHKMLEQLTSLLNDREKAINLLSRLGGPDQGQRLRLLHILHSGLSPTTDPFLFSCCVAIRSHHLYGLRKKTRIFVERGAVLIGGVDETRLLPEYCVFLRVRKNLGATKFGIAQDEYITITGPVLVIKHPVMHPGDVRMLLAVNIP